MYVGGARGKTNCFFRIVGFYLTDALEYGKLKAVQMKG